MTANPQKQGTVVSLSHESEILKNNPLGDPHVREVIVYLPPGYDESQSYPTVYFLTGFTGRGKMLLNNKPFGPSLPERLDALMGDGKIKPMIIVMPDCFTHYGGSQYINSSATGNYEDYLIREIVPFVDAKFSTVKNKSARGITGGSSGGYGALVLSMHNPDVFGLCASLSGDCYFEISLLPDFGKAFRAMNGDPKSVVERMWIEESRKGKNDFDALNIIGMSACYSPNPSSELGFDLPFDLETCEIREDVWQKWLAHDPVRMVEKYAENLKSLDLLFIDAGTRDEFNLDLGARVLCKRLRDFNISHIHEEFDDGHFNISYRYNRSLELISNAIEQKNLKSKI